MIHVYRILLGMGAFLIVAYGSEVFEDKRVSGVLTTI